MYALLVPGVFIFFSLPFVVVLSKHTHRGYYRDRICHVAGMDTQWCAYVFFANF